MALTRQREITDLRAGLERWLGRPVGTVDRPAPGWTCETLIVDREIVVRLPPVGEGVFPDHDLALEASVQAAAGAAGVPVAAPVSYVPDPSFLGAPFLAMAYVDGAIPGQFTPADPWLVGLTDAGRRTAWRSFVETLVTIHGVPVDPGGGADQGGGTAALRQGLDADLEYWSRYVDWATDGSPPALLADALAWCLRSRPADPPPSGLLWGDVRLGNVVFDPVQATPRAVLDWDMTSCGPFEMDLAWHLALETVQAQLSGMTVPGFGSRQETVGLVEERLGRPLVDLEWFEILALVRAGAISTRIAILFERVGQRSMFRVGQDPTLVAAARRIESY